MKRASSPIWGKAPMRRRWLSLLLLCLYIAAVHGLPALHLGWHRNDHVHALGGLRWLTPQVSGHTHDHATPHRDHGLASETHADERAPKSRPRLIGGSSADGLAPHLALGPAHGQQSLLAPLALAYLAVVRPDRLLVATTLTPSLRDTFATPRARAPPASV